MLFLIPPVFMIETLTLIGLAVYINHNIINIKICKHLTIVCVKYSKKLLINVNITIYIEMIAFK